MNQVIKTINKTNKELYSSVLEKVDSESNIHYNKDSLRLSLKIQQNKTPLQKPNQLGFWRGVF